MGFRIAVERALVKHQASMVLLCSNNHLISRTPFYQDFCLVRSKHSFPASALKNPKPTLLASIKHFFVAAVGGFFFEVYFWFCSLFGGECEEALLLKEDIEEA